MWARAGRRRTEGLIIVREDARSALASRNYRTYLYGSIFSLVGIWIQRLTIGWQAWTLTESAFAVGLVSAVQFLPVIVLSPFFGVLVDRIKARSGSMVMNALMGAIAAVLGIVTLRGQMTIEALAGLALVHGLVVSFYTPTRLALIPDLVPTRLFTSAVAISSIAFNLSRFAGPAIAGFIVAVWGLGWAYLVNALTYLPVILSLGLLVIDHESKPAAERRPYFEQLAEGIRYARTHPEIRLAIVLAFTGAVFGRGVLELLPAFAAMVFDGGSGALAVLMSSAGLGAVFGSLALSTPYLQVRLPVIIVGGCVAVGVALVILSLAAKLYAGAFGIAVLGLATTFVGVGTQSMVQVRVDNRLRGRVMSLWTLVGMGGPAVGSVLGGMLMRDVGAQLTTILYASACLLLVAAFSRGKRIGSIAPSSRTP